jgi:AraC-like DNA-binding protein
LADQNENEIHQQNNITKKGCNNKYVTSSLSEKEKEEIVSVLEYIMLTKKMFLNPDLKMTDIVSEISLPRKQISQVINENLNDNFYNYINRYRIEESKRLLENIKFDRFSIEGIAKQSGFNSRSSFYAAFKNETGITPSQFQHLCKT